MRWDAMEAPGDDSSFVGGIRKVRGPGAGTHPARPGLRSARRRLRRATPQRARAPTPNRAHAPYPPFPLPHRTAPPSPQNQVLAEAAPRLGASLDRTQLGFLLDKVGRVFVPRYLDAIHRLRR